MGIMDSFSNDENMSMFIISILSSIALSTIVISYRLFPELLSKPTHKLLNHFVLSSLILSISLSPGVSPDSTTCYIQGFCTTLFGLSSAIWSLFLGYNMYLMKQGLQYNVTYYTYTLCYLFPILLTILPLTNGLHYGHYSIGGRCFLVQDGDENGDDNSTNTGTATNTMIKVVMWSWISFYIWIWISVILNIAIIIHLKISTRQWINYSSIRVIQSKLIWYLPVICICWLIPTCVDVILPSIYHYHNYHSNIYMKLRFASLLTPCCQGFLISIIFWTKMDGVKAEWNQIFQPYDKVNELNSEENSKSFHSREFINDIRRKHRRRRRKKQQARQIQSRYILSIPELVHTRPLINPLRNRGVIARLGLSSSSSSSSSSPSIPSSSIENRNISSNIQMNHHFVSNNDEKYSRESSSFESVDTYETNHSVRIYDQNSCQNQNNYQGGNKNENEYEHFTYDTIRQSSNISDITSPHRTLFQHSSKYNQISPSKDIEGDELNERLDIITLY